MEPLALKEANYYTDKMLKDFTFGELVKERNLEQTKVEEFDFRFDKILTELIVLQSITKGESKKYIENAFKTFGDVQVEVMKLSKLAKEKNPDLTRITNKLQSIQDTKKKTVKFFYENIREAIKLVRRIEKTQPELAETILKLKDILETTKNVLRKQKKMKEEGIEIKKIFESTKEDLENISTEFKNAIKSVDMLKVKNRSLETLVHKLHKKLDDVFLILKDDCESNSIELEEFVTNQVLHPLPESVVHFVASKIKLTRDATCFQSSMRNGSELIPFKTNAKGDYRLYTYGTDEDLELCREAKTNGVDFVAKKGIYQITHNTFDIVLNFIHSFSFYETKDRFTLPEESSFNYSFQRAIPKANGYMIFNIPYFKIPTFVRKIRSNLTIEGMYRVDDTIKNVLFVCRYKQNNRNDALLFRKALLSYNTLPLYTEMEEIIINKGDFVQPKVFRPYFVDDEDIIQAFETLKTSFDVVEEAYRPKDKAIELERPLQEYKEGHLPAVATIEIVNGVYDLDEVGFANIYSTKIVQQDVEEEKEEMYKGELVKVISQKKKNVIVSKTLLPDGQIIELLNTK